MPARLYAAHQAAGKRRGAVPPCRFPPAAAGELLLLGASSWDLEAGVVAGTGTSLRLQHSVMSFGFHNRMHPPLQVPPALRFSRAVVQIAPSRPPAPFPKPALTVEHGVTVWPGIKQGDLLQAVQPADLAAVLVLRCACVHPLRR